MSTTHSTVWRTEETGGPASVAPGTLRRFSVDEYHLLTERGVLSDDARLELLDGWLVSKLNRGPRQSAATKLVESALERLFGDGWVVRVQDPISLETSEPEPDIVVARGSARTYTNRHPSAGDIAIVIEVAESILPQDRGIKRRVYAAASISPYWIVNLADEQIEVHRFANDSPPKEPTDETVDGSRAVSAPITLDYDVRQVFRRGETISVSSRGKEYGNIAVEDLLP